MVDKFIDMFKDIIVSLSYHEGGKNMDIKQIYKKFPNRAKCLKRLEILRWKSGPKCPYCRAEKFSKLAGQSRYHCNACNTSFSVTVGTIFHKTHVDLQKWFLAISLLMNSRENISARQLARRILVNKNTSCNLSKKIRAAFMNEPWILQDIAQ